METATSGGVLPTSAPSESPPLSEMSVALQFQSSLPFSVEHGIHLASKVAATLPNVELHQELGILGSQPRAATVGDDSISPRWWYLSSDRRLLLQVQHNIVALNWRRGGLNVEDAGQPYPGFAQMRGDLLKYLGIVSDITGIEELPTVLNYNVYYDNVWPLPSGSGMSRYFSFWSTIGIVGQQSGPEVNWSMFLAEEDLGIGARLDVNASVGALFTPEGLLPAARLVLNSLAPPRSDRTHESTLNSLHATVHAHFGKLTTTEAKEGWR